MNRNRITTLFAGTVLVGAVGCGSSDGGGPTKSSDISPNAPAGAQVTWKVLSSVNTDDGHSIQFVQLRTGDVVIDEKFPTGLQSLFGDTRKKSMAELYRVVQPDSPVPQEIVDADARLAEKRAARVTAPATPVAGLPAEPQQGAAGPKFYTAGQQAWFQSTICTESDIDFCQQNGPGGPAILGRWDVGSHVEDFGMVGSEYASICGANCPVSFTLDYGCNDLANSNPTACGEGTIYFTYLYAGQTGHWIRLNDSRWQRGIIAGEFGSGGPFSLAERSYVCFDSAC